MSLMHADENEPTRRTKVTDLLLVIVDICILRELIGSGSFRHVDGRKLG